MTDVQVDADGILSVLDNQRGRVFQYDKEQNPLCIFGGRGEQQGFFKNATALEKLGSEYLIADADKNSLTVFGAGPLYGDRASGAWPPMTRAIMKRARLCGKRRFGRTAALRSGLPRHRPGPASAGTL